MIRRLWLPFAFALCALPAAAQGVGSELPALPRGTELFDFTQTPARSFADFAGRAVLIEFFAHW